MSVESSHLFLYSGMDLIQLIFWTQSSLRLKKTYQLLIYTERDSLSLQNESSVFNLVLDTTVADAQKGLTISLLLWPS